MRLDLVVNLLTMQALTKGPITVLGGEQTRPNIHIDDLVDVYLFAFERRLAGVYNAGFENLERARHRQGGDARGAGVDRHQAVERSAVVFVCSDQLLATGFAPKRNVQTADPRDGRGLSRRAAEGRTDLLQRPLDAAAQLRADATTRLQ